MGRLFLLSLIFLRHNIKDGGYNSTNDKQAAFARPKYACSEG